MDKPIGELTARKRAASKTAYYDRAFSTEQAEGAVADLEVARGARGSAFVFAAQLLKALLNFVGLVVLSRLLSPTDFGLVAMVSVVMNLSELLRDFGLTTAAIRVRSLSNQQASNLFWINSALGLAASILVVASGPLLVRIYDQTALVAITSALSTVVFLHGLQAQIQVQLIRERRFGQLAWTDVLSATVALLLAIWAASIGWGLWALIVQNIVTAALVLITRVAMLRWVPSLPKFDADTRRITVQGTHYALIGIANYVSVNADTLSMGVVWGPQTLGVYNRAFQLLSAPVSLILSPLQNVFIPTLNAIKRAGGSVEETLQRVQPVLGIGTTLIFAATGASAPTFVPLLLGGAWEGAVPFFQILAVGGAARAFNQVSNWHFIVDGSSSEQLKSSLLAKGITTVLVVSGTFVSPYGTAAGVSVGLLVNWYINLAWLRRTENIDVTPYLKNGFRVITSGVLAALAATVVFQSVNFGSGWGELLFEVTLSAILFLGLIACTKRGRRELRDMAAVVRMISLLR